MKIAFKNFGCKANAFDSDVMIRDAERCGFDIVDESEVADGYVINSCTVTHGGDRDARSYVNRFQRQNPRALIGVVGCYAQVAKEELLSIPGVTFVVGTADKSRVIQLFEQAFQNFQIERDQVLAPTGFLPYEFPGSRFARAPIKIQDGCNYKCSFCIIPQARGRSRSLPLEKVVDQVDEATRQGFNEVVLTGIHLAHYGWDHGTDLVQMLRTIFKNPVGPRVRLSTLDPFEIPDEVLDMLGSEKRLCPHFHIALQSGSNCVLSRMKRLYKASEFVKIVQQLKLRNPDTFIGVDIIVGFPGEGELEFNETLDCLEKTPWSKLHVFPFSVRRGTAAERLEGHVPAKVIKGRTKALLEMSEKRYRDFLNSQLGKRKQVLLERASRKEALWYGHSENYIPVALSLKTAQPRNLVSVLLQHTVGERVFSRAL